MNNILLISLQKRGGGAIDPLGFSNGLCENKFKHSLLLSSYNEFVDRFDNNDYRKTVKVETYAGGVASLLSSLILLKPLVFMRKIISLKPRVIHVFNFHPWIIFVYIIRPFCRFKIIYSPYDNPFRPKEKKFLAWMEKFFVKNADAIVAYSDFVGDELSAMKKDVYVMHLGVYSKIYDVAAKKQKDTGDLNILFLEG